MKGSPSCAGVVTAIGSHHSSPNHVSLTVAHGPKKKAMKGMGSYDDRPTSNLMIHKKHAGKYHIGQHVNVAAEPQDEPEELF